MTGCNAWTVYQYNNYQGACACLSPSDYSNCYPGFYKDLGSSLSNSISSARKGCQSGCQRLAPARSASKSAEPIHSEYYESQ